MILKHEGNEELEIIHICKQLVKQSLAIIIDVARASVYRSKISIQRFIGTVIEIG